MEARLVAAASVFLAIAGLLSGCLESNPQPMPQTDTGANESPYGDAASLGLCEVDESLIYISSPDEASEAIVVGDSGAALDAEEVYVQKDENRGEEAEAGSFSVADDGSFLLMLADVTGNSVDLVFVFADGQEVPVSMAVPQSAAKGSDADAQAPWVYPGTESSEDPAGERPEDYNAMAGGADSSITAIAIEGGKVEVKGTQFSVTPLSVVVAVNASNDEKALANASNVGSFSTTLPGAAGDAIMVFAVNPADHSKATDTVSLVAQ